MLLSSLCLFFLPITSAAVGKPLPRPPRCLPSGDEKPINDAFSKGGKGTTVLLCPGSVHRLRNPVVFTAPRQTLTTEGDPAGRERAMLIVEGEDQATAIHADCKQCSWAMIQSLIVDGNRPLLLRVPSGAALIEVGNAEGQTVRDCRLYEPRGWSALHFREGDDKQCRKGLIVGNEIGPCGEEWDDEYDGVVERSPPWGNPRSDGISLACQDSLVEKNVVYDTTDGAIVLFGSAGTEVRYNEVFSRTRVVLGGINLVDYDPWEGDYSGVSVHHNDISALSRFLKVGIVIGPSSWSDDTDTTVHSASVTDNSFHGQNFGYGVVVSSVTGFTVLRNKKDDDAQFDGVKGASCPKAPENGRPTAFLINRGSAKGTFQEDFVNGEVQHVICIDPPPDNGQPYVPWRLRDSPAAVKAKEEQYALEHPEEAKSGFDSRMADALVSYQMTLMKAMDSLTNQVETLSVLPIVLPSESLQEQVDASISTGGGDISSRMGKLQEEEEKLEEMLKGMKVDFDALAQRTKQTIVSYRFVYLAQENSEISSIRFER
ncbi:hypothetical protein TREMEDRAFT_24408 [Tremella mesenterica DSM 1558]|uniref:uncharacterized protein n=1 Tax=Tremella mesenterica (strain ATCC 24925 / CBS 8224 / DSM 1558 / NBRC 9311 / NRRL Y-6157 / RJB 2259-6 / UBC 559-6) TaxID=578456 RepID=UPI0003F4A23C|nr:uncharacterized protein TREMEDRAFT_24408 [Tremella mesenterica DSM 1558]EIW73699.1 hypothetical protein TREMEDRAFT_24408 [Tremella mesenterica DSM 1558]